MDVDDEAESDGSDNSEGDEDSSAEDEDDEDSGLEDDGSMDAEDADKQEDEGVRARETYLLSCLGTGYTNVNRRVT